MAKLSNLNVINPHSNVNYILNLGEKHGVDPEHFIEEEKLAAFHHLHQLDPSKISLITAGV